MFFIIDCLVWFLLLYYQYIGDNSVLYGITPHQLGTVMIALLLARDIYFEYLEAYFDDKAASRKKGKGK